MSINLKATKYTYVFAFFYFVVITGCAGVAHIPIKNEEHDKEVNGIRYLRASPYLLVYSNTKGGIETEILYLPDPHKKMAANPTSVMADINSTMDFKNGMLTGTKDIADATAVPKQLVEAIGTIGSALIKALNEPKEVEKNEYQVPPPHIYKIVVKGTDVKFIGGKGDTPINITLLPQDAATLPQGKKGEGK